MSTTVFYPRAKRIAFYDEHGVVCGGMYGRVAVEKVKRMVRSLRFPRISFRKNVKIVL